MEHRPRNILAMPSPDKKGHLISYELGSSRKVHQFKKANSASEKPPHGAGSFYDPHQHWILMKRLDQYINSDNAR